MSFSSFTWATWNFNVSCLFIHLQKILNVYIKKAMSLREFYTTHSAFFQFLISAILIFSPYSINFQLTLPLMSSILKHRSSLLLLMADSEDSCDQKGHSRLERVSEKSPQEIPDLELLLKFKPSTSCWNSMVSTCDKWVISPRWWAWCLHWKKTLKWEKLALLNFLGNDFNWKCEDWAIPWE